MVTTPELEDGETSVDALVPWAESITVAVALVPSLALTLACPSVLTLIRRLDDVVDGFIGRIGEAGVESLRGFVAVGGDGVTVTAALAPTVLLASVDWCMLSASVMFTSSLFAEA